VDLVLETGVQLITAAVAFVLGVLLNRALRAWAYLRARKFWRPLLRRDLALVLGDGFRDLAAFEASQLVGRGDLVASFELNSYFAGMGIRQLRPISADRTIGVDPAGRGLRRNLIVIGGQDANTLTDQCLKRLRCGYKLIWADATLGEAPLKPELASQSIVSNVLTENSDRHLPKLVPAPHLEEQGFATFEPVLENQQLVRDYGLIVRARNPFISEGRQNKRIVLIYGCFGFGSIAAALFSMEKAFLKRIADQEKDIECIVSCDVIDKTPQAIRCVYFNEYAPGTLSIDLLQNQATT
jgi:hypothetical protein